MPIGNRADTDELATNVATNVLQSITWTVVGYVGGLIGSIRATAIALIQEIENNRWHSRPSRPLDPATAALAYLRGAATADQAADEAMYSGMDVQRFNALYETLRNAPSNGEMLDGWRRGLIGTGEFDEGLFRNGIREHWVDFYRALRHVPISAIEYLQGAVQGHIDLEAAVAKADGLGVAGEDAHLLYETLGNPPGIQEMAALTNRGVMTEAEFEQGIRESRYKNKYIPAIVAFRRHWPPPRTVTALLRNGAYTEAQARDRFVKYGLADEDATAYIASALHGKTATHKELAVGTVKALYADRVINRDQALTDLAKVGYAGPEALLILDLADAQARQKVKNQIVAHVHHLYVTHRIAEDVARAELVKIGVDEGHITDLLELWTWERQTPSKHLTIGQLNAAFKKGLRDRKWFIDRVVALGYIEADAELLSELDVPLTTP